MFIILFGSILLFFFDDLIVADLTLLHIGFFVLGLADDDHFVVRNDDFFIILDVILFIRTLYNGVAGDRLSRTCRTGRSGGVIIAGDDNNRRNFGGIGRTGRHLDLDTGGRFGILQAGVLLFIFGKEQADSHRD